MVTATQSLGPVRGATFSYAYTGRNQLKRYKERRNHAGHVQDMTWTVTSAHAGSNNSTNTDYAYDAFDRVTWVMHYLNGTGRTFITAMMTDSNNRKWTKRLITRASPEGNTGEVFDYDLRTIR